MKSLSLESWLKFKDQKDQDYPKNYTGYVVMKVFASNTERDGLYLLVCNKFNSSQCHPFYPNIEGVQWLRRPLKKSEWPPIATQMDQKVFETIGGVVYYIFNPLSSGWMVLFNIEGRTKYCFTAEGNPFQTK